MKRETFKCGQNEMPLHFLVQEPLVRTCFTLLTVDPTGIHEIETLLDTRDGVLRSDGRSRRFNVTQEPKWIQRGDPAT